MNIENRHLALLQTILNDYPHTFYVFGSRANNTANRFSDLDLCVFDALSLPQRLQLETAFEESDLPYKVDLVEWIVAMTNLSA